MSWWCNAGGGGVAGIAWVGTLCSGGGYNTNLNEKQWSPAGSGFVSTFRVKTFSILRFMGNNYSMSTID